MNLAQPTTSSNSGWRRSPRPFLQTTDSFNSLLAMLVSTSISCRGDGTWCGWLRVGRLAVSAQDTEVPEDQVIGDDDDDS